MTRATAELAVGLALVLAGVVALVGRPTSAAGPVTSALAILWFAPWVEASGDVHPVVRAAATAVFPLSLALTVHLASQLVASGHAWTRRGVSGAYLLFGVLTVVRHLLRDPFFDARCTRYCGPSPAAIWSSVTAVHLIDLISAISAVLTSAGAAYLLVVAARRGAPTGQGMVWLCVLAVTATLVGLSVALGVQATGWPAALVGGSAYLSRTWLLVASLLLAVSVGWWGWSAFQRSRSVRQLATDLAKAPAAGGLTEVLRKRLGDPSLRVVYPLPASEGHVDQLGRLASPEPADGQIVTTLRRDQQDIALMIHDRRLRATQELSHELGAAATMAIDNERLRAQVLARIENVRESSARLVETSDAERRRLERDLHDGAQQRLLASAFALRLALTAPLDGHTRVGVEDAIDLTGKALSQLRVIAHGIYPAVRIQAGLAAAIAELADAAGLPVSLDLPPDTALKSSGSEGADLAVYAAVAEVLDVLARRPACTALVRLRQEQGMLVLTIEHDSPDLATEALGLVPDRVAAASGSITVTPFTIRAEVPCELSLQTTPS